MLDAYKKLFCKLFNRQAAEAKRDTGYNVYARRFESPPYVTGYSFDSEEPHVISITTSTGHVFDANILSGPDAFVRMLSYQGIEIELEKQERKELLAAYEDVMRASTEAGVDVSELVTSASTGESTTTSAATIDAPRRGRPKKLTSSHISA